MANRREIILASGSPRRKELLLQAGIKATIIKPTIDEKPQPHETPSQYIARNSQEKLAEVKTKVSKTQNDDSIIIAADTIVVLDNAILEKPLSEIDAADMLTRLSGRHHEVLTSFCLTSLINDKIYNRIVTSSVLFRKLTPHEVQAYVATGEPMDKAGAYGAQGVGSAFISAIEGSYTNVVGLPLFELLEDLKRLYGYQPF